MDDKLKQRYEALQAGLAGLRSAAVGFSGGVDSTFLLKAAHDVLGDDVLAITVAAAVHPRAELDEAKELASAMGVRHIVVEVDALSMAAFKTNARDRCYHCKLDVFAQIQRLAAESGISNVADGTNADDIGDDRPGLKAVEELGILTPLRDAGLTKADIRALSHELDLPTWDKPAYACLATRFPYGTEITAEKLDVIERAEAAVHELGFVASRVRYHGDVARVEVQAGDVENAARPETAAEIVRRLKEVGFRYVTLDLQGYRVGSMSEGSASEGDRDD